MKILAVILNYKTPDMTLDALAALMRELGRFPDARVSIVDNDSQDGSLERIRQGVEATEYRDRVDVMPSDYNGGFAYGNNFAIARALAGTDLPDYVYLLNSDAFPDPGCVDALVDFLDTHPEAGIAGSYVHGPEPVPHKTAFRFPNIGGELEASLGIGVVSALLEPWIVAPPLPTETCEVDWLAGASMMIRRRVIEQIGLMDDTYFLYYEETDYCLAAHRAGWKTYYVVESSVTHIGSVSTGFKDHSRPTPAFWFASRRHYFLKNHGRLSLWIANLVYFLGALVCRIRYALIGRTPKDPRRHLRDFARFNFRLTKASDGRPPRKRPSGLVSNP